MRLRHIKGAEEEIAESPYVVQDPQSLKGRWHEFFGNDNPIRIEVGMGKGKFIMELAQMNPDINYVGIERYSSVLLRGADLPKLLGSVAEGPPREAPSDIGPFPCRVG